MYSDIYIHTHQAADTSQTLVFIYIYIYFSLAQNNKIK